MAIVPIEDVELLQELEDRFDLEAAEAAIAEAEEKGTISWEQMQAGIDASLGR